MSGRRGRGKAKDSPARGRGRGRGRGKAQAQADTQSVETSPVSEHVSEAVEPCTSANDKAATSELNIINNTKMNDPVESCIGSLQSTEETVETTQESKKLEVKTKKESDIINIDADAVILGVNVTDSSLEPSSNEPEIIELDSDDDDDAPPAKMNEEKELVSSSVDTKESFGLEASANEKNVCSTGDVINLDDDDDDDSKTTKDEHHFYCTVCDIDCKTKQGFENHGKGFYHCQRVKKTNEDKTVRDEEEKQAVDAAPTAEAESNQVKDEEEMKIEMDASTTETVDLAESNFANKSWILLDELDEVEALDTEEEKSMVVTHEDSSAAEGKEEPETVICDALGSNKEGALVDGDEQIKSRVHEDSCGIDGVESNDYTEVDMNEVTDKRNKKEAGDNVLFDKTDEVAAVDDMDEETGKCDVKELEYDNQNKELGESGLELTKNHEKNIDGSVLHISTAASCTSMEKETDRAESKDVEAAESNEQDERAGKSDETEEAATAEDSKEEGDAVVDPYYCAACDVRCENDKAYHMHTRGMMHTLNCGSSSSAAERPKPVPQVYRVPKTTKRKSKKSGTKKQKERKPAGEGSDSDVILIDDDESDETEEDDVEEVEESNSKDYEWLGSAIHECEFEIDSLDSTYIAGSRSVSIGGVADDTYYCDVCDCSMTSEQNYESHLIGARHKKNKKNRDLGVPVKKPKGKVAIGGHQAKVVDCEPMAQEMLNNCKDALIGLQYMTEFCHSSPDVEPRYVCNLCEAKCDIRMVLIHLTGLKHRINYLKKHHTNYAIIVQQNTRKSDQTPLADQYAKEIETSGGRQKMVVKMDMGGNTASGSLTKGRKDEQETASCREPKRRRASSENSKSPSGRMSPIDIRSLSPDDNQKSEQETVYRERRLSRSDSQHRGTQHRDSQHRDSQHRDSQHRGSQHRGSQQRDRSPRRWSPRRRTRSRSKDRQSSREIYPKRRDYNLDRLRDRRSSERDRHDHDWRGSSPERRRRSDYKRYEQDSRTEQGLMSAAQALYACGTNYPYARTTGVPYGLVSPSAFAMNSSYPAALGSTYPTQRATLAAPPIAKRSHLSDASPPFSASMSYASPNMLNMYGSLGAAAPYASLYGAPFMGPVPQPVPPVTQSPLLSRSSTGYQRSFRLPPSAAYGTNLGSGSGSLSSRTGSSDNTFSTLSSIVASVSSGTRDDDEAAAMSKVIAEAVIKYKMQKAQEKIQQPTPSNQYQRRY